MAANAAVRPAAPLIAIRMARAKDVEFFTTDPRRLRKYDNRDAIVMPEIYTYRSVNCHCGVNKTVLAEWTGGSLSGLHQIDLPGEPSYDAGASGHGAVW
jgi:hypothetical protein